MVGQETPPAGMGQFPNPRREPALSPPRAPLSRVLLRPMGGAVPKRPRCGRLSFPPASPEQRSARAQPSPSRKRERFRRDPVPTHEQLPSETWRPLPRHEGPATTQTPERAPPQTLPEHAPLLFRVTNQSARPAEGVTIRVRPWLASWLRPADKSRLSSAPRIAGKEEFSAGGRRSRILGSDVAETAVEEGSGALLPSLPAAEGGPETGQEGKALLCSSPSRAILSMRRATGRREMPLRCAVLLVCSCPATIAFEAAFCSFIPGPLGAAVFLPLTALQGWRCGRGGPLGTHWDFSWERK